MVRLNRLRIGIVGAGNVAYHLVNALENVGHQVINVHSRSPKPIKDIIKNTYQGYSIKKPDFRGEDLDLVIISVSDDQIGSVIKKLKVDVETIVVHTAGSIGLSVFEDSAIENFGAFYPLQTFSKNKNLDFSQIPIFTEANSEANQKTLDALAQTISDQKVEHLDSTKRLSLHIAAVFSCNFVNHMMAIGEQILEENNLPFSALEPLIKETIEKAIQNGPSLSQTGPAVRNDHDLLKKHLKYLSNEKDIQKIYKLVSKNIQDVH